MRTKPFVILTGMFCLLLISTLLFAHHGYAAYDMTATMSVKGTVTSYAMANPHGSIDLDVKDAGGNVIHYVFETGATVRMMKAQGFTQETLKPGDVVTVTFNPGKDSERRIGVFKKVELSSGEVYPKPLAGGVAPGNSAIQ